MIDLKKKTRLEKSIIDQLRERIQTHSKRQAMHSKLAHARREELLNMVPEENRKWTIYNHKKWPCFQTQTTTFCISDITKESSNSLAKLAHKKILPPVQINGNVQA